MKINTTNSLSRQATQNRKLFSRYPFRRHNVSLQTVRFSAFIRIEIISYLQYSLQTALQDVLNLAILQKDIHYKIDLLLNVVVKVNLMNVEKIFLGFVNPHFLGGNWIYEPQNKFYTWSHREHLFVLSCYNGPLLPGIDHSKGHFSWAGHTPEGDIESNASGNFILFSAGHLQKHSEYGFHNWYVQLNPFYNVKCQMRGEYALTSAICVKEDTSTGQVFLCGISRTHLHLFFIFTANTDWRQPGWLPGLQKFCSWASLILFIIDMLPW